MPDRDSTANLGHAAPHTCIVLAATARDRAVRLAQRHGLEPTLVLSKSDLARPAKVRRKVRAAEVHAAAICTDDWSRQANPQHYLLALAMMPTGVRLLIDATTGTVKTLKPLALALRLAAIPGDLTRAGALLVSEAMRSGRIDRTRTAVRHIERPSVMAIWPADPANPVGGSVTHISGILAGMRDAGLRTSLVTTHNPAPQLAAVVDDIQLIRGVSVGARLSADVEAVVRNRLIREAGMELARRSEPGFVYQRHAPFLVAGLELARALHIPFVLEWNGSEVWARRNWDVPMRVERILDPLLRRSEQCVASAADLVIAVSEGAADMARSAGATDLTLTIAPNGVDIADLDRCVGDIEPLPGGSLIGWIGTFGQWHGPDVLIEALASVREPARLLMIGDGPLKPRCVELARELGVDGRIEWAGRLGHTEAVRRLAACEVLASPHLPMPDRPFFGSPTKIFEYMALGRPIVASRLEQIGEVLEDGRTARLVPPGDVGALADALEAVLRAPDQYAALGRAARAEAERHHTWRVRADAILERLGCFQDGEGRKRKRQHVVA